MVLTALLPKRLVLIRKTVLVVQPVGVSLFLVTAKWPVLVHATFAMN